MKPTTPTQEPKQEAKVEAKTETIALSSLKVEDITLTNNSITPSFSPDIHEYSMDVQSDIYSVKVTPIGPEGATILINGEEVVSGEDIIVKLEDTYEFYGIDYTLDIEVIVTKGDKTSTYTIKVNRENASNVYSLFDEKIYTDAETNLTMPYNIYLPSNYDSAKKYPIVFALHGSGQRSQSLDMVLKRYEMATIWAKDSEMGINECIVLAPQCATQNANENWTSLMLYRNGLADHAFELSNWNIAAYNLLVKTLDDYSIDKDRVYMTGLSSGGFATFATAIEHPETFAALIPICGGANPEKIELLQNIPMWIFHAEDDPAVAADEYLYPTIKALDDQGIPYKLTKYEKGAIFAPSAHFSWTPAYANKEMRNWLFEQSR